MIGQPHSACRYAVLMDYSVVAVHVIDHVGALVSTQATMPGPTYYQGRPYVIFHEVIVAMVPNAEAARTVAKMLKQQDERQSHG